MPVRLPEWEGARMVRVFAIELLWPFTRPEARHSSFCHRSCSARSIQLDRCHSLGRSRHCGPRRSIFICFQKYGDEAKAETTLDSVLRGMSVQGMSVPPAANPPSDSCPYRQSLVRPFTGIYSLLPMNKPYILSCFLALLIVDACSNCCLRTACLPVTTRLGSTDICFMS
jgi:hypothetical protein